MEKNTKFFELHQQAMTNGGGVKWIAEQMGLMSYQVSYMLKKHGLETPKHKFYLTQEESAKRLKAYEVTRSDREAAEMVGIDAKTFNMWRNRQRLPVKTLVPQKGGKKINPDYVARQPMEDRLQIRHFLATLHRLVDRQGEHPEEGWAHSYIDTYRQIYGTRRSA